MRLPTPDGVYVVSSRFLRGAVSAALFLSLAACGEQVTSSLGCPQLCTDQGAQLRDTLLVGAVALDTTFTGFPRLGAANDLILASQGDTADIRVVARFDTIPGTYVPTGGSDTAITRVDSAMLIFVVDSSMVPKVPVRIEAFDVDTAAADTLPRALLPLFRADRLLGSQVFGLIDSTTDTLRIPLNNASILSKLTNTQRLRVGLRISNPGSNGAGVRLRILRGATPPIVRFRVSTDTTVAPDTLHLYSTTPADVPSVAVGLQSYSIIASPTLPIPASTILAVGGLGGARSYVQFDIPPIVLDSVQVIRATLRLVQRPSRALGAVGDTLSLVVNPVIAGPNITDLNTASQFIGSPAGFGIDTLKLAPRDSGLREIELVNLVRVWRALGTTNTPRAIVLRAPQEGELAGELNFFSSRALPADLRPSLLLTYVPRRGFGLP